MSVDYVISEPFHPHEIDLADIAVSKDGHIFKDRHGNAADVLAGFAGPAAEAKIKKLEESQDALVEAFAAVINLLPENRRKMILRELEKVAGV